MPKKYDLAIGIPSINEAPTISNVVSQIDRGLAEYYPRSRAIIVNVDNNSTDATKEIFLAIKTQADKKYITTAPGIRGKGYNLLNFFIFAHDCQVQAAATFDADLESITPKWLPAFINPLLDGYDFIYPLYARGKFDGINTGQVCYPIITGIFGVRIRQPIAGDFGFSQKYIEFLATNKMPDQAKTFGIDIHLSTQAVLNKYKCAGVTLGRKVHRRRDRATLGPMAQNVANSLFSQIKINLNRLRQITEISNPDIISAITDSASCPPFPAKINELANIFFLNFNNHRIIYQKYLPVKDYDLLDKMLNRKIEIFINSEMWCDLIYSLIKAFIKETGEETAITNSILPLFFAKLVSFIKETDGMNNDETDKYLDNQAQIFFNKRSQIFS
jgi:glycosyltransferase involved in cell wall biosynthesis